MDSVCRRLLDLVDDHHIDRCFGLLHVQAELLLRCAEQVRWSILIGAAGGASGGPPAPPKGRILAGGMIMTNRGARLSGAEWKLPSAPEAAMPTVPLQSKLRSRQRRPLDLSDPSPLRTWR